MVRLARRGDALSLGRFFVKSWREAGPGSLGFTGANDDAIHAIASEEFLTKRLASQNTRILIAERGGEVLGFASVRRGGGMLAELTGIVVLKAESRRGLGTRLLRKACDAAARLGYSNMTVKTEAFNAGAIAFYKKNGFLERRKTTEKIGRTDVPLMILERRLR